MYRPTFYQTLPKNNFLFMCLNKRMSFVRFTYLNVVNIIFIKYPLIYLKERFEIWSIGIETVNHYFFLILENLKKNILRTIINIHFYLLYVQNYECNYIYVYINVNMINVKIFFSTFSFGATLSWEYFKSFLNWFDCKFHNVWST